MQHLETEGLWTTRATLQAEINRRFGFSALQLEEGAVALGVGIQGFGQPDSTLATLLLKALSARAYAPDAVATDQAVVSPHVDSTRMGNWDDEIELDLYSDPILARAVELNQPGPEALPETLFIAYHDTFVQWMIRAAVTAKKQFEGEGDSWDHPQPDYIYRHLIIEEAKQGGQDGAHNGNVMKFELLEGGTFNSILWYMLLGCDEGLMLAGTAADEDDEGADGGGSGGESSSNESIGRAGAWRRSKWLHHLSSVIDPLLVLLGGASIHESGGSSNGGVGADSSCLCSEEVLLYKLFELFSGGFGVAGIGGVGDENSEGKTVGDKHRAGAGGAGAGSAH
jgi:hypothetical protein